MGGDSDHARNDRLPSSGSTSWTLSVLLLVLIAMPLLLHMTCVEAVEPAQQQRNLKKKGKPTLADKLYLNFFPPSNAARAIAPPSLMGLQAPLIVRFTLLGAIGQYEAVAACHPTALSFFGTKDTAPRAICADADRIAMLQAYTTYAAIARDFPIEAASYAAFLSALGLRPLDVWRRAESTTHAAENWLNASVGEVAWARAHGARVADFFANDGWNSRANWSRRFDVARGGGARDNTEREVDLEAAYEDYTGYVPKNAPYEKPNRLSFPLRWQPLRVPAGLGAFSHQVHVTPQLGTPHVRPLVLSPADVRARVNSLAAPFARADRAAASVTAADRATALELARGVIRTCANVTYEQRELALWWDNKLRSTAAISSYYSHAIAMTPFEIAHQFLGEMLAQHDALLLAWTAKRRHDLARPRTLIARLFQSRFIPASSFASLPTSPAAATRKTPPGRLVRGDGWRPILQEQPHSEFPSGSAALCSAAMEHMALYVAAVRRGRPVPPIRFLLPSLSAPGLGRPLLVNYATPYAAAVACGKSRLHAGVHFPPAVRAGHVLATGVGTAAFNHIRLLEKGIRPPNCWRCKYNNS